MIIYIFQEDNNFDKLRQIFYNSLSKK